MGHDRRMIDEAFDTAQAFGERKQMRVFEKAARAGEIGFQDDRHHAAESAHLFLRQLMLRMLLESRIINLLDLRFLLEPTRDLKRIFAMAFHSQRERFQSAKRQKTVERSCDRADGIL